MRVLQRKQVKYCPVVSYRGMCKNTFCTLAILQQRTYVCQQHFRVEGFCHVCVCPHVETFHLTLNSAFCRYEYDGYVAKLNVVLYSTTQLLAIFLQQANGNYFMALKTNSFCFCLSKDNLTCLFLRAKVQPAFSIFKYLT